MTRNSTEAPGQGSSILIVDDDVAIRETVTDALTEAGFKVAHAANGIAALEYLRGHVAPRLILLDWEMPLMDGPEMVRAMQHEPQWNVIPVILITGARGAKEKALEIRASGYLKKPLSYDDLMHMVDAAVRYPA